MSETGKNMSEAGKSLVEQQKFYEEPVYANGVEDGDEDGSIVSDDEVSEDGESIQTRIEQISIPNFQMVPVVRGPSPEEMLKLNLKVVPMPRVRQLDLELAMLNLHMKPMPGVSQVTIKKTEDMEFVISNPNVFKVPNSDMYVVLGNAYTGILSSLLHQPIFRNASNDVAESESESDESESDDVDESGSEEDDVDESGSEEEDDVDESWYENLSWSEQADIKLVMDHTGVSKRKAAKALKEFDGDVMTAIMEFN